MNDPTSKLHKCVLVGLATGEVRLYSEKRLVASYSLPAPATALCFGRYNREDNTLIAVTRAGALNIKVRPSVGSWETWSPCCLLSLTRTFSRHAATAAGVSARQGLLAFCKPGRSRSGEAFLRTGSGLSV